MQIETGYGPAEAELDGPARARFLLVLTHGAGGGVDSADLLAARDAGLAAGGAVARVLQPYRVRGARAPGSAVRQAFSVGSSAGGQPARSGSPASSPAAIMAVGQVCHGDRPVTA